MKRIFIFALIGGGIIVGFAFGFRQVEPWWYGDLLFLTCLNFGFVGLITGFVCGLFASHKTRSFTASYREIDNTSELEWSHVRRRSSGKNITKAPERFIDFEDVRRQDFMPD